MNRSSPANSSMNDDRVAAALHRQRRELQGGDPSLGTGFEHVDIGLGQGQFHRVVQVLGGLGCREAQVGRSDLEQIAVCPQRSERERRIGPGGDHQTELRWEVLEQERDRVVDLGRVDHVVVVEHQDDVLRSSLEIVDHVATTDSRDAPGRCRRASAVFAQVGGDGRERSSHVGPELLGVVVAHVEGQPGGGVIVGEPVGDQRGLAEASRSRDQRQSTRSAPGGEIAESRSSHEGAASTRWVQLRGEQHDPLSRWIGGRHCSADLGREAQTGAGHSVEGCCDGRDRTAGFVVIIGHSCDEARRGRAPVRRVG